jgi:predicted lactoylglutathione lyase
MHIPRVTALTLGVADLTVSTTFYETVFGVKRLPEHEGIAFFTLPGVWLMLYPLAALAADISPDISPQRTGFSGITLAHNARSREDVLAIFDRVASAGARIVKPPHDTFWGGFGGYFADPDDHYWEVVWGPTFTFDASGGLLPES